MASAAKVKVAGPGVLSEKQCWAYWQLERPDKTYYLFDGGGRCGKTWLICSWMIKQAMTYPGSRQLIVRKVRAAAGKTIFDNTLNALLNNALGWHKRREALTWTNDNGSIIRVDGLDDEERKQNVLGDDFLNIFLNEATQMSYKAMQMAMTRLAQVLPGDPVHKLILDCNPKGPRHWVHRVGVEHLDPETMRPLLNRDRWYRLNWTPLDNPYISEDVLEIYAGFTGNHRKQMLEGVWCENEGAIYNEWDEGVHLFGDPPAGFSKWPRILGIDFGYNNPFVCLWGAIDPDGCLWIYRELYQRGLVVSEAAKKIKHMTRFDPRPLWTVADHDAEGRAELNKNGIKTKRAKKNVLPGINAVKARLEVQANGKPRLRVSHRCTNLIAEMYEYVWEPSQGGLNSKEQPRKTNDHAQDALRYMVMSLDGGGGAAIL
jgi:phage terminase large subunit